MTTTDRATRNAVANVLRRRKRATRDFECQECHKKMTLKQAERAASVGCPNCGGVDIDLAC